MSLKLRLVLGIVFGAIAGTTFVALYNRTECSSRAQALAGCHYLKPAAGLLGGGILGAGVGGVFGLAQRRSSPPELDDPE